MNVNCNICSELFVPQSKIFAAPCGHTFHENCLYTWLERSETCPTCRFRTTKGKALRIYLNLLTSDGATEDPSVLQCKVDSLEFQLRLKQKELEKSSASCAKHKEKTRVLREEVKTLEDQLSMMKSVTHSLQSQIVYLKTKAKENTRAQEEIINLKKKIEDLEKTHLVLTATKEEVQDMIRHNNDYDTLCLLVTTLKKTLVEYERKIREAERNAKTARKDVTIYRNQAEKAKEENRTLLEQIECHKQCEAQRQQLKRKIMELQEGKVSNASTDRIVAESPAPLKKAKRSSGDDEAVDSPTIEERVQAIKESSTPYLRYKVSTLGFPAGQLMSGVCKSPGSFSVFKNPMMDMEKTKIAKPDFVANGLGGHSRLDEDKFPESRRSMTMTRVKRYKHPTKASSGRAKKLVPLQSKGGLDSFVLL